MLNHQKVSKYYEHDCRLIRISEIGGSVSFYYFKPKVVFWGKFYPKHQKCQVKLIFDTKTKSNMQNSMVVFTFSVLGWKYHFWATLFQEIKIVRLSRNLVPILISIRKI